MSLARRRYARTPKPVGVPELAATLAAIKAWEPPVVRGLIMATSGHFAADAVDWAEVNIQPIHVW